MIYLYLDGGLGNQLLQYAFARSVSLESDGEPITIVESFSAVTSRLRKMVFLPGESSTNQLSMINIWDGVSINKIRCKYNYYKMVYRSHANYC